MHRRFRLDFDMSRNTFPCRTSLELRHASIPGLHVKAQSMSASASWTSSGLKSVRATIMAKQLSTAATRLFFGFDRCRADVLES